MVTTTTGDSSSDAQLVAAARSGDHAAFGRLVAPHVHELHTHCYRMLGSVGEAEDAVQEAWLRLSRSDTSDVANLTGWLTTVVGRVCLDRLRARDVKVTFDGTVARKVRVTAKGMLVATAKPLAPGRHRVVVTVRDGAGNTRTSRWWIRVLR